MVRGEGVGWGRAILCFVESIFLFQKEIKKVLIALSPLQVLNCIVIF